MNKIYELRPSKYIEYKDYFILQLKEIRSKRKNFVPYEKIKNVYFDDEPFSTENKLVTNTSKLEKNGNRQIL